MKSKIIVGLIRLTLYFLMIWHIRS